MGKYFLIMTDLDSTFEEYNKDSNEFEGLAEFINNFEKEFNCEILFYFVSGTAKEDLVRRLEFFKEKQPEVFKRIEYSVLGTGKKYDKNMKRIGICSTNHEPYNKAYGVSEIIDEFGRRDLKGACFIGDGSNDIPGFETMKGYSRYYQYELGGYTMAPRSRRDYENIKMNLDFYSEKPRILGCIDCLNQMRNRIRSKIDYQSM